MKYIFESHEIEKCLECPFKATFDLDNAVYCKLNCHWYKVEFKPSECPLEEVKGE